MTRQAPLGVAGQIRAVMHQRPVAGEVDALAGQQIAGIAVDQLRRQQALVDQVRGP
jgi:hypothetical protein